MAVKPLHAEKCMKLRQREYVDETIEAIALSVFFDSKTGQ